MATANGVVESQGTVRVYIPELETEADLLVMRNCPAVLSMGRLIEDDGYQFTWHSGEAVLTSPSGARLRCEVRNYVPSLEAGSLRSPRAWESFNFHAHFPEFAKLYLMSRRTPSRMNVHLRTHLMKLRTLSPRRHLLMMMEILFLTEAPSRSSI